MCERISEDEAVRRAIKEKLQELAGKGPVTQDGLKTAVAEVLTWADETFNPQPKPTVMLDPSDPTRVLISMPDPRR